MSTQKMAAPEKRDGRMAIADAPMVVNAEGSSKTVMESAQANMVPTNSEAVPASPGDGAVNVGTTPVLTASASGIDDFKKPQYRFLICPAYKINQYGFACTSGTAVDSGWTDASSWQVPDGQLAPDTTYTWTVGVKEESNPFFFSSGSVAYSMATGAALQDPGKGSAWSQLSSPANGSTTTSLTPALSGHTTMAGADPYQYDFQVFTCLSATSCQKGLQVADSGWLTDGNYTIPDGVLYRSANYVWSLNVRDNPYVYQVGNQNWSFGEIVPLPTGTYYGSSSIATAVAGVDLGDRHYSTTSTDANASSAGGNLALSRTYSSTNPNASSFGVGWSSVLDMLISDNSIGETVRMGDGHEVAFGLNPDGSYSVDSRNAGMALTGSNGNFVLTDAGGNSYSFTSNTLTSMTNGQGLITDVLRSSGQVFALTDRTSGRSIGFVWSGSQIATAYTSATPITAPPAAVPPITSPAASWTYTYSGTTLTKVCRSGTHGGCHSFGYTADSTPLLRAMGDSAGNPQTQISYTDGATTGITDASGTTKFSASPGERGDTIVVTKQSGAVETYTTNIFGEPVGLRTRLGAATNWTYDIAGRMTAMNSDSTFLAAVYDVAGHLIQHSDSLGTQKYTYVKSGDGAGKLATASVRGDYSIDTVAQSYQYDSAGRVVAILNGPGGATQRSTTYAYTSGAESAVGGGSVPAGLVSSTTNAAGTTESFEYDKYGQLAMEVDVRGLTRAFAYDSLGDLTRTTLAMPHGSGAYQGTAYSYGSDGRLASSTGSSSIDSISGAKRQVTRLYTYDDNGNVLSSTDSAASNDARTHNYTYDTFGRRLTESEPSGDKLHAFTYDASGNLSTDTDARGSTTRYTYDEAGNRLTSAVDYRTPNSGGTNSRTLETDTYAPSGQLATRTDASGQTYVYTYRTDALVATITAKGVPAGDGTHEDLSVAAYAYDAYGQITQASTNDAKHVVTVTYDQFQEPTEIKDTSQPRGADAVTRDTRYTYDALGDQLSASDLAADGTALRTEQLTYDPAGAMASDTIRTSASSKDATTTWYQHDPAGRLMSVTDPDGSEAGDPAHTTRFGYAADDLPTTRTAPPTSAGTAVTTLGYDEFGRQNTIRDATGAVTTVTFDKNGNIVTEADPSHSKGGKSATTNATYDAAGDVLSVTDANGATTNFDYDSAGNRVRTTSPASSAGGASRVSTSSYDAAGNVTSSTTPSGANTTATYDGLRRLTSSTLHLRVPLGTDDRTTSFDYIDSGYGRTTTTPGGGTTTELNDAFGQLVSVSDPDKVTTRYGYDLLGDRTTTIDGVGTTQTVGYDPRGRATASSVSGADGKVVRSEALRYDAAGNQISATDPRGNITALGVDAAGHLTSITAPGQAAATATYDLKGRQTGYTDPTGASTTATYTPAGDLATLTAPATASQQDAALRTRTYSYDAVGHRTSATAPDGSKVTNTFDTAGNVTGQTATAAGSTATRTFGYDAANRLITFSTSGGLESLTYDDSDAITSANGPDGNATFEYDADGKETSRTDAAGRSTSTYTPAGRLKVLATDGASEKLSYVYDNAGRVRTITSGGSTQRTISHDAVGDVLADTVKDASGANLYGQVNTWDANGNLTSTVISPSTAAGSGTTGYTYDADEQLSSWTAPGKTQEQITWDGAKRATQVGAEKRTYNQQGELLTAGSRTYNYSAAGSLASVSDGPSTTTYTYDPFGQLSGDGVNSYSYDAVGRLTKSGDQGLTYAGLTSEPATIGSTKLQRSADGTLTRVDGAQVVQNAHGDLTAELSGASLTGSTDYDPFGARIASGGSMASTLGFQSQVTSDGLTHMGSRWYDAGSGSFLSRDRGALPLNQQSRYSYGAGNPTTNADPEGNCVGPVAIVCAGAVEGAEMGSFGEPGLGTVVGGVLGVAVGGLLLGVGLRCATTEECLYGAQSDSGQGHAVGTHGSVPNSYMDSWRSASNSAVHSGSFPRIGPLSIPKIGPLNIPKIGPININIDLSGLAATFAGFDASMSQFQKSLDALNQSLAQLNAFEANLEMGTPAWVRTGVVPVGAAVYGSCAGIGSSGLTSCSPAAAIPSLTTAVLPAARQNTTVVQNASQAQSQAPATSGSTSAAGNGGCEPGQVSTSVGCETLSQILQRVVTREADRLSNNTDALRDLISPDEQAAEATRPFLARPNIGKALERIVQRDDDVNTYFEHVGGNSPVDFVGKPDGLGYEMTTDTPSTLARHLARPEVDETRIATYSMRQFARYLTQLFGG
ncbi:RHS repeat-associated core domain-containing protein [Clavibacter sp. Sh2088]|uniref:RHS repeat-associated core domain-containing protein n=1 Tax=Clavibacter sp. Sh2088 TaxID=3397676 RepID=UPI0039DFCBE1